MADGRIEEFLGPVLLGIGWSRPGGLNRYVRDLHRELHMQGVSPHTVVLGPAVGAPAGSVTEAAAESDLLVKRLWRYARVSRAVSAGRPVVDVHFAMLAWLPVMLGLFRRSHIVVHFHGPWAQESLATGQGGHLRYRAKRLIEGQVYRRADTVVVLSAAFAELVVDAYAVDLQRVHVIPPGVDLQRFTPDREAARRRLGLTEEVVVFSARRLVPRMGLDVLLEAWRAMGPPPRGRLVIAGEGPARPQLEEQVAALGLSDSVHLLGRISEDDLVDRYRSADVTVLPSLSLEGFGLSALESLACGVPVVVTDAGGLPEVVAGLDVSLVVTAGSAPSLARRLGAALAGEVPTAGACRAHAATFSWPVAAARHLALYRDETPGRRTGRAEWTSRRLRVVYLNHCALLSGGEIALVRLIASLQDVEAHVILGEDGPLRERLVEAGAVVEVQQLSEATRGLSRHRTGLHGLPWRSAWHTVVYVHRLVRRLRELRPDVVHTNSLKAALYGSVAGRLAGVPVVWHARDRIAPDYLPASTVWAVRVALRWLPSVVIANSASTLETLHLPARRHGAAVVVPDPYRPSCPAAEPPRRPPGSPLRVGMVGRFAPWKGQHVFLQAFASADPTGDSRAVLIGTALFGESDYEAEVHGLIDALGLRDRVDVRGFQYDVEAELAQLDVLVHASTIPEPFGQVVVEGLAAGLAVVAAGSGGPAEIISDGVDGLLHRPGDVQGLARVLRSLMEDPALRTDLGQSGRLRARAFDPRHIERQVSGVYRTVLARD